MTTKNANIKDVAAHANVSIGSVSRYLNGHKLKNGTEEKIKAAIEILNYKKNPFAQYVRKTGTNMIGILVPDIADYFPMATVSAVDKALNGSGYYTSISAYGQSELNKLNEQEIHQLKRRFIDGLIFFPSPDQAYNALVLDMYLRDSIPVVVFDQLIERADIDVVMVDNFDSAFRSVEYLIHKGHKDIAIIAGDPLYHTTIERLRGYTSALDMYDIPLNDCFIMYGAYSTAGGFDAARQIAGLQKKPTALFVTNDKMAVGMMMAFNETGIKIPDDISVIAFDHSETLDVFKPTLTYVEQPISAMGECIAAIILKRIKKDFAGFPHIEQLKTKFVIQNSVKNRG